MRAAVLFTVVLAAQSPLYDYQRELEGRRRESLLRQEEEVRGARPVAVAFRQGKPIAWVSVVDGMDQALHCGIPTEAFVFDLKTRELWRCTPDGARTPFLVDYSVLLATGPVQLVEWHAGAREERTLR